ncbi:MAG: dTDP-4-dehydrorhamnose 3,5-epimerase [Prevotella sp.]|nr:dTDP-4-dehydrorhamnose 3,5-epimerase [Prevotella sp.]
MNYIQTEIKGAFVFEPKVFKGAHGYFVDAWKQNEFYEHVGKVKFIKDKKTRSYNVLRALCYKKGTLSQAKLVRVIKGRVVDVAVDIRQTSPTFGKHVMVELSEDKKRQFYIPRGLAHGFLVLSDEAYEVDNPYALWEDNGFCLEDPAFSIQWLIAPSQVITSKKVLKCQMIKGS